ncbi:uncharacterized protein LOC101453628 [Ceratitis capitata]|nr:uncharacterized protein LOC101453628 [Ceratitis capitata]
MTKFLSFFNLSRINDSKDFLGTSPDYVKGNIIITLSRNIVIVVKISTQQQICSWSTHEKLSSKVIFDNSSRRYVGVFGNRYIRCWDASSTDINTIKRIKLHKLVVDIVPSSSDTIILYSDGSWDWLSTAISSSSNVVSTSINPLNLKYDCLKDVNANLLINGVPILSFFVQGVDNKETELIIIPLTCDGQRKSLKITRKDMTVSLSGYSIVEGDNAPMLLTIWSDQRLFLLNLDETLEAEKSPGNFVSIISTLKVDTPLSVLGVARNCVAIYGANSNQEGASLILYNTQFKIIKAQQFFKVYFSCSRIWIHEGNIIIAMGQNLSVVTYRMSQELLVDLLGTYNSENHVRIEGDLINEEDYLQSICSYKNSSYRSERKEYIYNNISNGNESYSRLKEKLCKGSCLGQQFQTFIQVDQDKSFLDDTVAIVETSLEKQLINRTLFEFFIRQFESYGTTEQEISEKMLLMLSKNSNSLKITSLMSRLSNSPESIFTKVFFSMLEKSYPNILKDKSFASIILKSFGPNTVFQPSKQMILMDQLRNDFSSFGLLYLLEYFYKLLTELSASCSTRCNIKVEMKIICWFDILLNAYFQQLILSKDIEVLNLLLKWTNLISTYTTQVKKLEELSILLYSLVQKEYSITNPSASIWYCIEDLYF